MKGRGKNDKINCLHLALEEKNMDWLPPTNYNTAHCKALDTPNLISVYTIEDVSHSHVQNAHLDWFSSKSGLGVVLRQLLDIR